MTPEELADLLAVHMGSSCPDDPTDRNKDRDLFEAGLDSMAAFFLLDDLAQRGINIEFADFLAHPTPAFLWEAIKA